MQHVLERVGVDGDVLGGRAVPVEHGGDLAGSPERLGARRAEFCSMLDGELKLFISHGYLYKRRG